MLANSKKHRKTDPRILSKEKGFVHVVAIPWVGQSNSWWNESCADVLEVFGLPGKRFTSHPKPDVMEFYFKSPRDAELCKILLSDRL